jgi:hypothetical protein
MSLWKRGSQYWMDVTINGQRSREPLGTPDWREARSLEKRRIAELAKRPPDPSNRGRAFASLNVETAIDEYAAERRAQVSPRTLTYWKENARPLAEFFDETPLRKIGLGMIAAHQNHRVDQGRGQRRLTAKSQCFDRFFAMQSSGSNSRTNISR